MARHGNLDGTRRAEFTVGPGESAGLRAIGTGDAREVALFDPVSGQATLAELLEGGAGIAYYLLDRAGGFVYVGNGEFLTATIYDT